MKKRTTIWGLTLSALLGTGAMIASTGIVPGLYEPSMHADALAQQFGKYVTSAIPEIDGNIDPEDGARFMYNLDPNVKFEINTACTETVDLINSFGAVIGSISATATSDDADFALIANFGVGGLADDDFQDQPIQGNNDSFCLQFGSVNLKNVSDGPIFVWIPDGFLQLADSKLGVEGQRLDYTLGAESNEILNDVKYVITPDPSQPQTSLRTITITFPEAQSLVLAEPVGKTTLTGPNANFTTTYSKTPEGNSATFSFGAADKVWAEGEYTLTIAQGLFAINKPSSFDTDKPGNSPKIEVKFTVGQPKSVDLGSLIQYASPEEGEAMPTGYGMAVFQYMLSENVQINTACTEKIQLMSQTGVLGSIAANCDPETATDYIYVDGGISLLDATAQAAGNTVGIVFGSVDPATLPTGDYMLIIPDGFLQTEAGASIDGTSFMYTMAAKQELTDVKYEFDPAEGSTVESLRFITVTFPEAESVMLVEPDTKSTLIGPNADFATKYPDPVSGSKNSFRFTFGGSSKVWDAGEYTLTIAPGTFAINDPKADDMLPGNSPEIVAKFKVGSAAAKDFSISDAATIVSPEDGAEVTSFSRWEVYFEGKTYTENKEAGEITLTCNDQPLAIREVRVDGLFGSTSLQVIATDINAGEEITTPGEYAVKIPAGYLVDAVDGSKNLKETFYFTLVEGGNSSEEVEAEYTLIPADEKCLTDWTLTIDAATKVYTAIPEEDIMITTPEGKTFVSYSYELNGNVFTFDFGSNATRKEALSKPGIYTVTIPAGMFWYNTPGAEWDPGNSAAIIYQYEIKEESSLIAPPDGIKFTPANGSTVSSLYQNVELVFGADVAYPSSDLNFYDQDGNAYKATVSNFGVMVGNQLAINFEQPILKAGTYVATIEAGAIMNVTNGVERPWNSEAFNIWYIVDGSMDGKNEALKVSQTMPARKNGVVIIDVAKGTFHEYTDDDGNTYTDTQWLNRKDQWQSCLVKFDKTPVRNWGSDIEATLTSENGEVIASWKANATMGYQQRADKYWGFRIDNPTRQNGKYTLTIPEGFFLSASGTPYQGVEVEFEVINGIPAGLDLSYTVSPEAGTYNSYPTVEFTYNAAATIKVAEGAKASISSSSALLDGDVNITANGNKVVFTPSKEVTFPAGASEYTEFTLDIPAEAYTVTLQGVDVANDAISIESYKLAQPAPERPVVTPAEGYVTSEELCNLLFTNTMVMTNNFSLKKIKLYKENASGEYEALGNYKVTFAADKLSFTATYSTETALEDGKYRVIIPAGGFAAVLDGKRTNCREEVYNFTVGEAPKAIAYATDPEAGATVEEITSVKITFPEMKEYVGSNGSITATDGTTSVTLWDDFSGEGQNFINYVSYDGPIATAGTWTIDIPEGALYVDGTPFQGCSFTVNVTGVAPKEIAYTTDPAEGATVEAFSTFSITFTDAQSAAINENIKATNGTETITLLKDLNKGTFGVEGNTAYFIVNGDPITADGQWTVNIADGDLYADGVKFQGCSVTFTVKAQETPVVPVEPTFGEKIYLVGQPQGWDINSAAMPLEKTAEGVYTGTFDIKDGEFMLRFYTELGDWNKNSIGSQEFDGPIDVTMTDGEYSGSFVFGQGSWNIAGWTAAKVTFTVDANTKTVKFLRHAGIGAIFGDAEAYDVYTVTGVCVLRGAEKAALDNLENGLYIINGKKVMIRK